METPRAPHETPWWARWALLALVLAAGWLRLPGLTAEEPWFDEVFSIVLASQDLPELLRRAIADQTNPPGFYLLLWGWSRLGGFDLGWMRLLPAIAGTLTVPAIAFAARATGASWWGALIAAALAVASPLMLGMSGELRAYAPLALVTALAIAAAGSRRPVALALCGLALVSLHYFGALVVASLALGALWTDRTRPRRAIAPALPAAITLGAWALVVVWSAGRETVGGNAAWVAPAGLRDLPGFASQVIGTFGTSWGAVAVSLALLAALALGLRAAHPATASADPSTHGARLAVASAVLPLLLVAVASALTGRGLWVARYLIIALPGWCLLLARALDRPAPWRATAVAALLAWAALAGPYYELARPRKTAWSLVARALTAGTARTICVNESFVGLPLRYQSIVTEVPLTVLDLAGCTAPTGADAIVLRVGTEASLDRLRAAGAAIGPARALGTTLPATSIHRLTWPAR